MRSSKEGPGGQATGGGGVAAGPFEADKHRTNGLGLWVRGCGRRRELSKGEGRAGTRGSGRELQSGDGDAVGEGGGKSWSWGEGERETEETLKGGH